MSAHAPPRRRHLGKRHALCPQCSYDLVATVADNRRICPECGQEFDLTDLCWQPIAGDFTFAVALRATLAVLLPRAALCLLITLAALGLLVLISFGPRIVLLLAFFVITMSATVWMARIIARDLEGRAGYAGFALYVAACGWFSFALFAGWLIACLVLPDFASLFGMESFCAAFIGNLCIIHALSRDQF